MAANGIPNPKDKTLFSFEFVSLCIVLLSSLCGVSVFYSFYHYLDVIGIPVAWRGFLLGLEAMTAFVLRLFVLPWLHLRNAMTLLIISLILSVAVSCSYLWATQVSSLILLRIIHGAVFTGVSASTLALIVNFIPENKSGQGFSILSVAMILPFALIPPLSEWLIPYMRNEADIYAAVSVFSLAAIFPMLLLRSRIGASIESMDGALLRRLRLSEIRDNLRLRTVRRIFLILFLVLFAHVTFFYFMKNLTLQIGTGQTGVFFALAITTMIAVRLIVGGKLDRTDKKTVLKVALALFVPCLFILPHVSSLWGYYGLGILYGLCIGMILPLLQALLFEASPPSLRGFNANMTVFSSDAAYFIVPYLGGALIAFGADYGSVFYVAGGLTAVAFILMMMFGTRKR